MINVACPELCPATIPVHLFNDLFAYMTIDISERVFVLMEEKASIWRTVCSLYFIFQLNENPYFIGDILFVRQKCSLTNVQW